ncbi:hypothetical protein [Rhizobium sullae]|uniref:Uncharacterized protein n=1 Tax=Rhizobium sullae TaxID=50338 RepID=A0A4R3Q109_RHISU|nr:hypothetical protein [Rhizobium sullae]TCU14708.1 hypothetical protein EV132_10876 [Rhizobium sullae]
MISEEPTPKGLRICLIGTSNSVYKDGYAGAIRDDKRVSSFTKFSMGASPSIIIPYFGSELDFSTFDFVIFETAINDRNYYKYGSIRKDQIRNFVEWGVSAAAKAGCHVALLVMPSRKAMNAPTISGTIYQRIAAETGATLLNGFDFVRTYAAALETQIDELFIDDFHIQKQIANRVGRVLIDKMVADRASKIKAPTSHGKYYRLHALHLQTPAVLRTTSLISEYFFILNNQSQEIQCSIPASDSIVGVTYNAAKSSGKLVISSSEAKCIKSLTTKYFGIDKELLLIACPLTNEVRPGADGLIRISLGGANDHPTEQSRFEKQTAMRHDHGALEIACLIMRSDETPLNR